VKRIAAVAACALQAAEQFNYEVVATLVAAPDDVGNVERRYDGELVLVTNTPLYSARQRLLVVARPSAAT
jgi:sortase (surface protein transpeptidase)